MPKTGVDLTEEVKGVLPVPNGGTGAGTLAAGAVLLGNGTAAPNTVAAGTPGNVLTDNGSTWVSSTPSDPEQFITLTSAYTLASGTAAQKLFNSTTNGALTVPTGSYFFECMFSLSSLAASSGTYSFLFGGTATIADTLWQAHSVRTANALNIIVTGSNIQFLMSTSATSTAVGLVTASAATNAWSRIAGKMRVSGAGTLIPQIALSVSSTTAAVGVDSYFRIWNVGSSAVTNVGAWS